MILLGGYDSMNIIYNKLRSLKIHEFLEFQFLILRFTHHKDEII